MADYFFKAFYDSMTSAGYHVEPLVQKKKGFVFYRAWLHIKNWFKANFGWIRGL